MADEISISEAGLLRMTTDITSAYVSFNPLPLAQLPGAIIEIGTRLRTLISPKRSAPEVTPAIPVKQSVRRDHIVCLEDGKEFKSLKRHLHAAHGLTPAAYLARWGLPADYPMVAPEYSAERSTFAKAIGLGTMRKKRAAGRTTKR